MIGRGAQGNPWIFREILHYLATAEEATPATVTEVHEIMRAHIRALHEFYGERQGVRVARKHFGWYLQGRPGGEKLRQTLVRATDARQQLDLIDRYFCERAPLAA
jgi:tRNA-dihydrouridine synthase B